jgi:hypothetical protein
VQFIRRTGGLVWELADYQRHLDEHASQFPPGAREFATAEWHYDIGERQCPHDSWLEEFSIKVASSGDRSEIRSAQIFSRYLGSYHDGYHNISYDDVVSYVADVSETGGDWIVDEITVDAVGMVRHEILFEEGLMIIRCKDLHYSWTPR